MKPPSIDEAVSIIVPVFNERPVVEAVIRSLLEDVVERVPGSEVVVVDDCSTDGTLAALRARAAADDRVQVISSERNRGHGPTLMTGLRTATKSWLFLVDADGQIPARAFIELWSCRARADLIMGRRDARRDPRHRVLLSRLLERVVRAVAGRAIPDPNVPFKLVRRDVWLDLRPHIEADARTPSLLIAVGAALRGWRSESVSVEHLPRPHGRSKLRARRLLRLGAGAMVELLSFRGRLNRAPPRSSIDPQAETPPATLTR